MAKIKIPYSNKLLEVEIPDHNLAGILESKAHDYHASGSREEIVNSALDHPTGSATLEELVQGRKNMVIRTSDHTRPVPSKVTMEACRGVLSGELLFLWVVTLLSTRSVRNINHPLCGCAVFVIQKNHLSVIIRLFKPIYNERKGDFNGQ
jgi:hypothetical protein